MFDGVVLSFFLFDPMRDAGSFFYILFLFDDSSSCFFCTFLFYFYGSF